MFRILLLTAFLAGCDPWPDVQKADTIEAYENYVAEHPDSLKAVEARARLEQLYLDKARKEQTVEAYDAFLKRFPKGDLTETVTEERQKVFWAWAEATDTPEAWQRYIDESSRSDPNMRKARRRLRMSQNKDKVSLGAPEIKQVNLAEDPKGPLDGWQFSCPVTNAGTVPIEYLVVQVSYLDAAGKVIGNKEWPTVASALPGNMPFSEGFNKPIAPGETRTWGFATSNVPDGWAQKITVKPTDIRLVGDAPAPASDRTVDMPTPQ